MENVVGVDIGKARLDAFCLGRGQHRTFDHDAAGIALLVGDVGSDQLRQVHDLAPYLVPVFEVVLEGGLAAPGAREVWRADHRRLVLPVSKPDQPWPDQAARGPVAVSETGAQDSFS